jgi:hypothetical protein
MSVGSSRMCMRRRAASSCRITGLSIVLLSSFFVQISFFRPLAQRTKMETKSLNTSIEGLGLNDLNHVHGSNITTNSLNVPFKKRLEDQHDVGDAQRFVVLSASVTDVVHETPYSVLLPLSARSWLVAGFRPIILLAVNNPAEWQISSFGNLLVQELETIPGVLIYIIPSPSKFIEVPMSQVSRLFASFLVPDSELDSYLRVSDADMIIYQSWPFRTENISGVHVYNGDCCLPQRPMHSIGMSVRLWRQLFSATLDIPIRRCSAEELAQILTSWLVRQGVKENKPMSWARREWSLDQVLAGQVINNMRKNVRLTVSPVMGRVHYPHHPLTQTNPAGEVVESHEHRIVFSQLLHLQRRIDLSNLHNSAIFRKWNWTSWVTAISKSGK